MVNVDLQENEKKLPCGSGPGYEWVYEAYGCMWQLSIDCYPFLNKDQS